MNRPFLSPVPVCNADDSQGFGHGETFVTETVAGVGQISDRGVAVNQPPMDADLARVVTDWPRLPEAIEAANVEMVWAAGGKRPRGAALACAAAARDTGPMPTDAQSKPVAPKRKRRWLQFGLRTLFVLVAAAAIGLGFWVNPAERQKRAVAAVKILGGTVSYENDPKPFSNAPALERAWYRKLLGDDYFSSVVFVYLGGKQVSDTELEQLAGLTQLEQLHLNGTQVTDAGLAHLKGLTQLERLSLDGTKVTDAGVAHLKGLAQLEELNLYRTQVTDAGLVHLKELTRLKSLNLYRTRVTAAGTAELRDALPGCNIFWP